MFTVVTTAVGSRCVVGVNDLRTRDCIAASQQPLSNASSGTVFPRFSQRSIHAPVVFDFARKTPPRLKEMSVFFLRGTRKIIRSEKRKKNIRVSAVEVCALF